MQSPLAYLKSASKKIQKRRRRARDRKFREQLQHACQLETLENRHMLAADVSSLTLLNDTGTPGDLNASDPTLAVSISDTDNSGGSDFQIEFDVDAE